MHSVYDNIATKQAVLPVVITGTGTPAAALISAVDTMGHNSAMFDVSTGSATGTAGTYTVAVQVQECATSNGTFTDVSGATATITGTTTAHGLNCQVRVDGLGISRLRYLRVMPTLTVAVNASLAVPITATCVLDRSFDGPVANSAAVSG